MIISAVDEFFPAEACYIEVDQGQQQPHFTGVSFLEGSQGAEVSGVPQGVAV